MMLFNNFSSAPTLIFTISLTIACFHLKGLEQSKKLENERAMWVKTEQIFQGESFYLYLNPPNHPYLGVIDPKGHFFYVAYPATSSFGNLKPFIESNLFVRADSLQIPTGQMKADPTLMVC